MAADEPGGPLFDPLLEPLPSELAGEPGLTGRARPGKTTVRPADDQPRPWEETQLLPPRLQPKREEKPRREPKAKRRSKPAPGRTRKARVPLRRVKRTITHVNPLSILKLSLFFYAIFFVVWLLFAAIVYNLIASTGVLDAIADIVNAFGDPNAANPFELTFGVTMKWAIILGIVGVFVGSLINAVVAFLYNVANDVVGGAEVTFSERDE